MLRSPDAAGSLSSARPSDYTLRLRLNLNISNPPGKRGEGFAERPEPPYQSAFINDAIAFRASRTDWETKP